MFDEPGDLEAFKNYRCSQICGFISQTFQNAGFLEKILQVCFSGQDDTP